MESQDKKAQIEKATGDRRQKKRATGTPAHTLAAEAIEALLSKKAKDVVVMDMREVSGIAEFFVIATGESDLQMKAMVDAVRERIRETHSEKPWHIEGLQHPQWVVVDYVDVVVHLFSPEKRAFYDLERLWGDAPSEQVPDEGGPIALLQTKG